MEKVGAYASDECPSVFRRHDMGVDRVVPEVEYARVLVQKFGDLRLLELDLFF